jgi:hypothetical protein
MIEADLEMAREGSMHSLVEAYEHYELSHQDQTHKGRNHD